MKKRLLGLLLCGMLAVSLVACGNDKNGEETAAVETEQIDKVEEKEEKTEEKKADEVIELGSKNKKASSSSSDIVSIEDLGDDIYEFTVGDKVTYVEFYGCEMTSSMEYAITDYYSDFETDKDKSFQISYNTVSDTAAEAIIICYSGDDVIAYALERDGMDGSIVPVEVDISNASSDDSNDSSYSNDSVAAADDYLGAWGFERISCQVTGSKSGNYVFTITWPDSAAVEYEWNYYCAYDSATGMMVCDAMADKQMDTYDDNGELSITPLYDNGSGCFNIVNGVLYWVDNEEGYGDDIAFVR